MDATETILHTTQTALRATIYASVLGWAAFNLGGPTAMLVAIVIAVFLAILRQISLARRYPDFPAEDLMLVAMLDAVSGTRAVVWTAIFCISVLFRAICTMPFLWLFHVPDPWMGALLVSTPFGLVSVFKRRGKLKRESIAAKSLALKSDLWLRSRQDSPGLGEYVQQEMRRRTEAGSAPQEALAQSGVS